MTDSASDPASREDLNRLEELVTYQEQQIQDLSDMLLAQGKDIDRLKKYVVKLEEDIGALQDDGGKSRTEGSVTVTEIAAQNKPPHY